MDNFLMDNEIDNKGMAISLISTSRDATSSDSNPFTATWDYIEVYENQIDKIALVDKKTFWKMEAGEIDAIIKTLPELI